MRTGDGRDPEMFGKLMTKASQPPGYFSMAIDTAILALLLLPDGTATIRGDEHFSRMEYQHAICSYDEALTGTDSTLVFSRLAHATLCLGDISPDSEKDSLYRAAERYSRRSIGADSLNGQGHLWLAAAIGSLAMKEGAVAKVHSCREIKEHLDIALRLDPDDDVALSIQGTFYCTLGNVSWIERQLARIFLGGLPPGGYEDAERVLLRAISISPDRIRHHAELGQLYMLTKRNTEALKEFRTVLDLPITLASDRTRKTEATHFIEELKGRQ
jgi:tetratricopeptide (TPR) repeat protein